MNHISNLIRKFISTWSGIDNLFKTVAVYIYIWECIAFSCKQLNIFFWEFIIQFTITIFTNLCTYQNWGNSFKSRMFGCFTVKIGNMITMTRCTCFSRCVIIVYCISWIHSWSGHSFENITCNSRGSWQGVAFSRMQLNSRAWIFFRTTIVTDLISRSIMPYPTTTVSKYTESISNTNFLNPILIIIKPGITPILLFTWISHFIWVRMFLRGISWLRLCWICFWLRFRTNFFSRFNLWFFWITWFAIFYWFWSCIWLFCHMCICLSCKSWHYTQHRNRKACNTEFNKFICFHNFLLRNVDYFWRCVNTTKILIIFDISASNNSPQPL